MKTKVGDEASDSETTIGDLKALVRAFAEARGWREVHNPKDLAIGLVTEACELLEIFRFRNEEEVRALLGDGTARTAIADELADALYCLLRFAETNGFDLSRGLRAKLVKTGEKYPIHQ